MIKSTYATYDGLVNSVSAPVSINAKIQVTDQNASHVKIQTDINMITSFAPAIADRTIVWVNKTDINFQPDGETLARTYDAQIITKNFGTRTCIAYDYVNEAINATYYVDKILVWPIRIVYQTSFENQTYSIEINLKETNIKGF